MRKDQISITSKSIITDIAGLDDIQKELWGFFTKLFDIMFPVGAFFGGIALAASMYRSMHYGWYSTLFLNVGMYLTSMVILILRRRLPPLFMFLVMIGLISIEVVHSLYYRGLASSGMMNLTIVCIFTGIFLGKRAGIIAVVLGTLTASLCGVGYFFDILKMSIDVNDHLLISLTWVVDISLFIMYVICLILTVNGMQRRIVESLYESKETASRLKAEIEIRKQVEHELRKSEEKYRSIFDNATMGIFQSNSEGRYLNVNPAYAKLHGFDSPEQLLTYVTDIETQIYINPEDYRQFSGLIESKGIVEGYEIQRYHRTRDKIWVLANARRVLDENGKTLYYEGTVQNITDRKRTEEALRESEGKFRDLAEKSLVGVYLVQDDMFKYVNLRFAEILYYAVDEITGKMAAKQVIFPEDWPMVEENLRKRISGERESLHYELRVVTKDKQIRDVEVYSSRTLYQGKPAVIGTLLDITERKRAEEALKESEAKLRKVIDLVPHFIFAKDIQGHFVLANKAVADAYGTTVEALTGKADADFNPNKEEVEQFLKDDLAVIISGQPKEIPEERITDSTGHVRLLQTTKIPFTLSSTGDAVLGVSTDITERKRAGKALEESEEKYRNIFENAVEGIFQTTAEGNLISGNPALARMAGFDSPEEMIAGIHDLGQRMYVYPQDRIRFLEQLEEHGFVEAFEMQLYRKDRKIIWASMNARAIYDEKGKILSIEGIIEDITKRKRIEQTLLESEAKYRSVVESSLAGFCIIQDDTFRFVNRRFCDIAGYEYDELVNTVNYMDLVHPDHRIKVAENIKKRYQGDKTGTAYNFKAIRKDGRVITVKTFGSLLSYGGRTALFGTFIDITKEKTMESQLRQAQKMEAIGTLAGGIAHDFNNILTALIGYATLIQAQVEQTGRLRRYADQILSASHKGINLIQSLLAFSRERPLSLKPVNLNTIIRGTEKLLKRLITEDITLETHLTESDIVVLADATQIDQILFNLTTNSRDAMPRGGTLNISSKPVLLDDDSILAHGFGKTGRYALLSVSDTGMGMDKKTLEKSFDPFFTTKEVGKGTGLGLSTVYGIVKQHNGSITVDSEPDRGTSFHIYLPAVESETEEERPSPVDIRGGRETILVAEDSEEARHLVKDILDRYGYTVFEAVDGEDAVAQFQQHDGVDLVILDSVMPKLNGREAYDAIRSLRPTTRFLFMSGYTRDIVLDKGIRENEFEFLRKPLLPDQLLKKIRKILDREE